MLLLGGLSTAQAAEDVTMTLSTETQRFTPGKDYEINGDVTNRLTVKALQGGIIFPKGLTAVKVGCRRRLLPGIFSHSAWCK